LSSAQDAQATPPVTPRVERFTSYCRRAAVAPRCGPSVPPLTVSSELCRPCAVSPCLQAPQTTHRRLVPLLVPSVLPSTACTPGPRGTTPAGPSASRATKTVTAHRVPLAS